MKGYVYGLINPLSKEIVYVGSTIHLKKRHYGHLRRIINIFKKPRPLYEYFINKKIIPEITVLEEVDFDRKDDLYTKEAYWIVKLQENGCALFNKNIPGKTSSGVGYIFVTVRKMTYISVLKYIEEASLKMTVHEFFDMAAMAKVKRLQGKSEFELMSTPLLQYYGWAKNGGSSYGKDNNIVKYDGTNWYFNGELLTEQNYSEKIK